MLRFFISRLVQGIARTEVLASNEIIVSDSAVPLKYFAPLRYGSHCPDVPSSTLRANLRIWTGTTWARVTTPKTARTCKSLTPGLYQVIQHSGKTLEYFSVG